MIVHLAGAPGSGKSTIAQQVAKQGWVIYDLDDLNMQFVEGNDLISLTRTDPKKVTALYQNRINELIYNAKQNGKSILFVGINSGILGTAPGSYEINVNANHNVLLNVDTAQNARLWIQRDMPNVLDQFVTTLKQEVQEYKKVEKQEAQVAKQYKNWFNEIMQDFRPSKKKDEIIRFKKFYYRKGYTPMIPSKFIQWFGSL
jgi:guanylate kinase